MNKTIIPNRQEQEQIDAYFKYEASYWKDIYATDGVQAEIYRERHKTILNMIKDLHLPQDAKILEIGCGAGLMSIDLAMLGYTIQAIDTSQEMVDMTRQHAEEAGVSDKISVEIGDINALTYADTSFDFVLAIGVIPWVARPDLAMHEMARVTKAGGYLIFTADNHNRLNHWVDPSLVPIYSSLRRRLKVIIKRSGLSNKPANASATFHSARFIDNIVKNANLVKIQSITVGFGPFTFFRKRILSEKSGIALHQRLQRLSEQNSPVIRSTGSHYIVTARK